MIKNKFPDIPEDNIDLHTDSSYYWGPENYGNASDWVMKTILIIRNPDVIPNEFLFTNFFGIIDDNELVCFLKEKTVKVFETLKIREPDISTFIASTTNPEIREHLQRVYEAKNLIEAIRKDFSEDEKFMLRFIRHRYCHITLSNFAVKIDGEGDDIKFRTSNWERLVRLSKTNTISSFRASLINKLKIHEDRLARLNYLISTEKGFRFFAD